jgi:multidrug resistance efflux pump
MNKRNLVIYGILTLSLLLAACTGSKATPTEAVSTPAVDQVVAEAHLVPRDSLYLSFAASGRVSEILVKEGEAVNKGQVLIRLGDHQQAEAALTGAQAQKSAAQQAYDALLRTADLAHAQAWLTYLSAQGARANAQLAWDMLDHTGLQTDIDNAQADLTSSQTDVENAQKDFDKYKDLPTDNATRKTYEDALNKALVAYDQAVNALQALTSQRDMLQANLDAAHAAEAEARRSYENTANGADTDKLALAKANLDAANVQVTAAQAALENYDLKAPFNGTVVDLNVSENELVGPTKWVALVADLSQWYADTSDLSELDVVKIDIGQKVNIKADALPELNMTGVVESISLAPKSQSGDILYTVHIRLEDVDPLLRWGMTLEVTFVEK